jgi:hypothetical protein
MTIGWSLTPQPRNWIQDNGMTDTDNDGIPDTIEDNYRGENTLASIAPKLPPTVAGEYSYQGITLLRSNTTTGPWVRIDAKPSTTDVVDLFSPSQNGFTDTNLVSGQNYCYQIYSTDAEGQNSDEYFPIIACSKPGQDTIAPTAPKNLGASPLNGAAQLNWSANTEPDLAGYHVYICQGIAAACGPTGPLTNYTKITTALLTIPFYTAEGLSNDLVYWFRVKAVDNAPPEQGGPNVSEFSTPISVIPTVAAGSGSQKALIPVKKGWNLVAMPMQRGLARFAAKAEEGTITLFGFNGRQYLETAQADAGQGYWLYSPSDAEVEFPGDPFEPAVIQIPLQTGWNLVGHPFQELHMTNEKVFVATNTGTRLPLSEAMDRGWVTNIYTFDPGSGYLSLSPGTALRAGQAFWVTVNGDYSLELNR